MSAANMAYFSAETPEASEHFIKDNRDFALPALAHKDPLEDRVNHLHSASSMNNCIVVSHM